jgi:hypothetical protein
MSRRQAATHPLPSLPTAITALSIWLRIEQSFESLRGRQRVERDALIIVGHSVKDNPAYRGLAVQDAAR